MPNLPIRNHRTSETRPLRLAMVGMVEENGHPFSWSAIINGHYDSATIRKAGYGMIVDYLAEQPASALGLPGCELTHIWCDHPEDAAAVAESAKIENCVGEPTDVIGHVDAVIIPTDKGDEHLERARPFVEAGLPVLIDKPLAISTDQIDQFRIWYRSGKIICSTSAMRYAHEFRDLRERLADVGDTRLIVATCAKSWERYGIHAVEAVYGLLSPGGWLDVCNTGDERSNIVHVRHAAPADVVIAVNEDMFGGFCHVTVYGTKGRLDARFSDRFNAFRTQLQRFIDYVRGDAKAFDMNATIEQCQIIAAGMRSRNLGGQRVAVHTG